jgi:hypothetical protein
MATGDDALDAAAKKLETAAQSLLSMAALRAEIQARTTPHEASMAALRAEIQARTTPHEASMAALHAEIAARGPDRTAHEESMSALRAEIAGRGPDRTAHEESMSALRAEIQSRGASSADPLQQAAARQAAAPAPTPQGQAQAQQMRVEQSRLEAAQAEAQKLKEGPQAQAGMAKAQEAERALGALKVGALAAAAALGTIAELGAKASPTHAATLQTSFDLLAAKLGIAVLPAMEEVSRALQDLSRAVPADKLRQFGETYARYLQDPNATGFGWLRDKLDKVMKITGQESELKLSYAAMPQAQMGTFEQQYDRMQMAALQEGPAETELLQLQLQALEKLVGIMEQGTGPEALVDVNFR